MKAHELGLAMDHAAGILPEDWEIRVTILRGAWRVQLFDPDGYEHAIRCGAQWTIREAIDAAAESASDNCCNHCGVEDCDCRWDDYNVGSVAGIDCLAAK